jgi:hypothetical protein
MWRASAHGPIVQVPETSYGPVVGDDAAGGNRPRHAMVRVDT